MASAALTRCFAASAGRMEPSVRFEEMQRFIACFIGMEPPPRPGVTHRLDVKSVGAHAIKTLEGQVKLFVPIVIDSGSLAQDKSITSSSRPLVKVIEPLGGRVG